jgi:hypothetical protein
MRNTAARCDEDKLITELRGRLSKLPSVKSTHFVRRETALSVWIGIRDQDRSARYALYELEDRIPLQFPNVKVDFHVVPISPGSSLEAFIAAARPEVRRTFCFFCNNRREGRSLLCSHHRWQLKRKHTNSYGGRLSMSKDTANQVPALQARTRRLISVGSGSIAICYRKQVIDTTLRAWRVTTEESFPVSQCPALRSVVRIRTYRQRSLGTPFLWVERVWEWDGTDFRDITNNGSKGLP